MAKKPSSSFMLVFDDGAVQFRQRLVVSLLSNRPLLIRNIRADSLVHPGLAPPEVSFLRLLDSLTDGSRMEINSTGTQLRFFPGMILGGDIHHECPVGTATTAAAVSDKEESGELEDQVPLFRSIGWFLEGLLPLALFGKHDLNLTLTGITDGTCHLDPSVDYWRRTAVPVLQQHFQVGVVDESDFLSPQTLSIRVVTRGAAPCGGGKVVLHCPAIKALEKPVELTDFGKVKRVRGTAVSCKLVSSSMAARVSYSAKGLLHRLLPDVWIHTDVHSVKQHHCGPSPGLSLLLTAETTTGLLLSAESCMDTTKKELPEELGRRGAAMLLEEIRRGGCIDTSLQSTVLLLLCLTPEDVSRIRLGTLSQYTIASLRLFKEALGVEFKIRADPDSKTVLLSCLGTGYRNMAKAST